MGAHRIILSLALLAWAPAGALAEPPAVALGAKLGVLRPASRVDGTVAVAAELRWRLPFHARRLALAVEVGWNPLGGSGTAVDPQLGAYDFEWSSHTLEGSLGVEYAVRVPGAPAGLAPLVEAGFTAGPIWSSATCTSAAGTVFIADHPADGFALGWYAGAGLTLPAGPGLLLAALRHVSLRTDMGYPWLNTEDGELQGSNLFLGYRLPL